MIDFKKDYYKILEVNIKASSEEIKLSYRRLAKKYHPDLNPDKPEYAEIIKVINEANEILGDKDERYAYDQYLIQKKAKEREDLLKTQSKNKRYYEKTITVDTELRTYIKGKITIKYQAKHIETKGENILRESLANFYILDKNATIKEEDKFNRKNPPTEFESVFKEHAPFYANGNKNVKCDIISKNNISTHYELEIEDLTIPNPVITNVTKHEGLNFGTIEGDFYGYIKKIETNEEPITVEECFGETGKKEDKEENGDKYYRKEYFNTDCTTYWGNWIRFVQKITWTATGKYEVKDGYRREELLSSDNKLSWTNWKYQKPTTSTLATNSGCLGGFKNIFGGLLVISILLLLIPQLLLLLPFVLLPILFNLLPIRFISWFSRLLFGFLFLLFIFSIASSIFRSNSRKTINPPTPVTVIPKPNYEPIKDSKNPDIIKDTLISHIVQWQNYDSQIFKGKFWVTTKALNEAKYFKNNLQITSANNDAYERTIYSLKENDKNKLNGLYQLFDSLSLANKLNQYKFAEMVVSFVQSIPYALVLEKDCNPSNYQDNFTRNYLETHMGECDGNERFGINTPVEFLASLKGDCDTRTLLIYTVLAHYDYDVVVLSSDYYSHSMIGINLPYQGATLNYQNQKYVFWETTAPNVKPGLLPEEMSNTNYWRISLKSK